MLPSRHIIVSIPLGAAVGFFTESFLAGLLCFLSGIIIDIDHLIEYTIHYDWRIPNFKEVYQACSKMANREEEGGTKKLYLVLHVGEIAILLWIGFLFSKNIYLLSIALGYSMHITMDAMANALKPWAYFLTWRMKNGFNTRELSRLH